VGCRYKVAVIVVFIGLFHCPDRIIVDNDGNINVRFSRSKLKFLKINITLTDLDF
jgi:hypothetical protein